LEESKRKCYLNKAPLREKEKMLFKKDPFGGK
jgi:hypothetical protein